MRILNNKYSNIQLKNLMFFDTTDRITISFYKYFFINNPDIFRNNLYKVFKNLNVLGRVYISHEGINAQISVPKKKYSKLIYTIKKYFVNISEDTDVNIALDTRKSFWVLRMKVKQQLLSDNLPLFNFLSLSSVGHYISAKEVNSMICDNNSVFIDIRNHYEYKIGHFDGAINIPVNTFKDQLSNIVHFLRNYKNKKKIVMYCTGGIRCEKSTAWIKYNGFKNVYHIKGGIIKYVNDAKKYNLPVKFRGKNFVFDERMYERVSNDVLSTCDQCNDPCDTYINCCNNFCHSLFIQCKKCSKEFFKCCSKKCKETILNSKIY